MAEPADRFYESQGLRLHYADWGNESAPPLILIHGGLDHCRNWDAIATSLRSRFHVIAPDLRGHGDSDWARGSSYSLSDNVYDLSRLLRHAGLKDAAIVGHSMGGLAVSAVAQQVPNRIMGLVMGDTAFGFRTAALSQWAAMMMEKKRAKENRTQVEGSLSVWAGVS